MNHCFDWMSVGNDLCSNNLTAFEPIYSLMILILQFYVQKKINDIYHIISKILFVEWSLEGKWTDQRDVCLNPEHW